MTNVCLFLIEAADMYPDAAALRCDGATTSYSELADQAARFAAYLDDQGVRPGDRVGVMLGNRSEFAVVFYGVLYAGAVVVPINPVQSSRDVEFFLTNTGACLLCFAPPCAAAATSGALAAGVPPVVVDRQTVAQLTAGFLGQSYSVTRAIDDTAVIMHTSAVTAVSRGVQLTHGNLVSNQAVTARTVLSLGPGDIVMGCLPLFCAFGMTCALVAAISTGATLTLLPRFDPNEALEMIAAERVTVFEGVPAMYAEMLGVTAPHELNCGSLRVCISVGAAMPAEVLHGFEDRFGCTVLEGYGLSETSLAACFNRPGAGRKAGSIGTPIDGVQMRVVDERGDEVPTGTAGQIQVRGHNVMKGYWNAPEDTQASMLDGWFSTGDIGRVDDDGYFYLVDRKEI